jgi:hypothetical protein
MAQLRKRLFKETAKVYPNFKVIYEPYNIYNSWSSKVDNRQDASEIMPADRVILCQEDGDSRKVSYHSSLGDVDFVLDQRIFAAGLIDREHTCSSTPDMFNHSQNLRIAGYAAMYGSWTNFYGRWGGTNNMPRYQNTVDVPDRLKLIRVVANWDNINDVPLSERSWDPVSLVYSSPLSYTDMNLIYSTHPENHNLYFVVLDKDLAKIPTGGKHVSAVYKTDGLFRPTSDGSSDFLTDDDYLYLKSDGNEGSGYILILENKSESESEVLPPIDVKPPHNNMTELTSQDINKMHFGWSNGNGKAKGLKIHSKNYDTNVEFSRDVNFSRLNPGKIIVERNRVKIDDPELELSPANITMYGVRPNFIIYRNKQVCGSYCTVQSFSAGTLRFSVPRFSEYELGYNGTGYIATYDESDVKNIMIDSIGTAGASFVSVIDLVIIALVLLAISTLISKFRH